VEIAEVAVVYSMRGNRGGRLRCSYELVCASWYAVKCGCVPMSMGHLGAAGWGPIGEPFRGPAATM
jgi:hypothetical protein